MMTSWRRSCRRPLSYAAVQKLIFLKNVEVHLFEYRAAELKSLVGAPRSAATGQADDLPGKIGSYGEIKEVLREARLRRKPRARVCTTLGDEGRMLALFGHDDNCGSISAVPPSPIFRTSRNKHFDLTHVTRQRVITWVNAVSYMFLFHTQSRQRVIHDSTAYPLLCIQICFGYVTNIYN